MCILWYGARLVIAGQLTAGRLSAFVVYAIYVAGSAGSLMGTFSSVVQVRKQRLLGRRMLSGSLSG